MPWDFHREEQKFEVLPEGKYRIRISSAEKANSKSGNDMLALQFQVSGSKKIIYHYIVFMKDRPEITNRMLTQFFDSFKDIAEGDLNTANWIGKVGAAQIKHEEYNGNTQEKISYFIKADRQNELPVWVEPPKTPSTSVNTSAGMVTLGEEEDLPF